jgi:hypothetical protein
MSATSNHDPTRATLADARTAEDFGLALDRIEDTTDQAVDRIKEDFKQRVDKIRSSRYQPGEATRLIEEARSETTTALDDLREEYETQREEIFTTAVSNAFPVGSASKPEEGINRRDAMMKAAALNDEMDAQALLARAVEVKDHELVAAIVREANRRDWTPILQLLADNGDHSQKRGAETLMWVRNTRQEAESPRAKLFGSARFSTPAVERPRLVGHSTN